MIGGMTAPALPPVPPAGARIAVVGAGAAGLTAAWLLRGRYAVTLFEAGSEPGGHALTHVVADGPDAGTALDVGFMVLNDRNYPTMHRLLKEAHDAASSLNDDPAAPMAEGIIQSFHTIADGLEQSLDANDTTALIESCMQVRGSAPALGLSVLSRAAEVAVTACTSGDPAKRNRSVRELIAACRALTAAA